MSRPRRPLHRATSSTSSATSDQSDQSRTTAQTDCSSRPGDVPQSPSWKRTELPTVNDVGESAAALAAAAAKRRASVQATSWDRSFYRDKDEARASNSRKTSEAAAAAATAKNRSATVYAEPIPHHDAYDDNYADDDDDDDDDDEEDAGYGYGAPVAAPSTPSAFANHFPSKRILHIHHDDTTVDGNMNLRVDVASTNINTRVTASYPDMTLFHLRMHDLRDRSFSLRRYCRDSGREICHSSRKKPPSVLPEDEEDDRSALTRSVSHAWASLRSGSSLRTSNSKSSLSRDSNSTSNSTRGSTDSNSSTVSTSATSTNPDEYDPDLDEPPPDAPKPNLLPNHILHLEFSNYAHVDIERRGSTTSKRYMFEYWGREYIWKRQHNGPAHSSTSPNSPTGSRRPSATGNSTGLSSTSSSSSSTSSKGPRVPQSEYSYHLYSLRNPSRSLANLMPLPLTPAEEQAEQMRGGWVPPSTFELTDRAFGQPRGLAADVADTFVATGLIALVDDCIRNRWHRSDADKTRTSKPTLRRLSNLITHVNWPLSMPSSPTKRPDDWLGNATVGANVRASIGTGAPPLTPGSPGSPRVGRLSQLGAAVVGHSRGVRTPSIDATVSRAGGTRASRTGSASAAASRTATVPAAGTAGQGSGSHSRRTSSKGRSSHSRKNSSNATGGGAGSSHRKGTAAAVSSKHGVSSSSHRGRSRDGDSSARAHASAGAGISGSSSHAASTTGSTSTSTPTPTGSRQPSAALAATAAVATSAITTNAASDRERCAVDSVFAARMNSGPLAPPDSAIRSDFGRSSPLRQLSAKA